MSEDLKVELLTPLDLLMPRIYVVVTLTFRAAESTVGAAKILQPGLNRLVKQVPWLSGRIFIQPSETGGPPSPEIRWNPNDAAPTLVDKGSIEASYQKSSANGMPPAALPTSTWPVPGMVDDNPDTIGAPVFAASLFQFADGQGVGMCVCIHHYAVDATSLGEIIRLWAKNVAEPDSLHLEVSERDRCSRLREAVSLALAAVASRSTDEVFKLHPEYSRVPPTMPAELLPCTFKMFKVPLSRIVERQEALKPHIANAPTTNTLLCALMWSAITSARTKRNPTLVATTSQLTMAVNTRRRIKEDFSTSHEPYFGNAVLCAHSQLPVADLHPPEDHDPTQALAKICEVIAASAQKVDSHYVAEVYSLVERTGDYRAVFAGWDLFGARDLTITSWASLDLYDTAFGTKLGKPEFVRVPPSEIDSICGILPRRRVTTGNAAASDEMLEVIITLHTEDMEALEQNATWQSLAEEI